MSVRTWTVVAGAALLCVGILATGRSDAADDAKATKDAILKVADALQKGDEAAAKKLADKVKDADLEDIMNVMLPRNPASKTGGGIGLGPKPGAITPDGIEKKVQDLEKNAPKAGEAEALERAGYIMKAIQMSIGDKVPKGKKPAPWKKYNADYDKAVDTFIAAAKKKDAKGIQAAAVKLNNSCIACHNDYK